MNLKRFGIALAALFVLAGGIAAVVRGGGPSSPPPAPPPAATPQRRGSVVWRNRTSDAIKGLFINESSEPLRNAFVRASFARELPAKTGFSPGRRTEYRVVPLKGAGAHEPDAGAKKGEPAQRIIAPRERVEFWVPGGTSPDFHGVEVFERLDDGSKVSVPIDIRVDPE